MCLTRKSMELSLIRNMQEISSLRDDWILIGPIMTLDIRYSLPSGMRISGSSIRRLWPAICKIYPGGGYSYDERSIAPILQQMNNNNEVAIVTQDFIGRTVSKYVKNIFTVYGAPLLSSDDELPSEKSQHPELNLCFTSLGFHPKKGLDNYIALAKYFDTNHPDWNIKFHIVGVSSNGDCPPTIIFHGVLDSEELDRFYYDTIDIFVSPVKIFNDPDGFPLGGEAMLKGCIPLQCDPHNANKNYGFNDTNSLTMTEFDLNRAVTFVEMLYTQPDKRKHMSDAIIKKAHEIFSPRNQLDPIVNIIKREIVSHKILKMLERIPVDFIGGCPIDKALIMGKAVIDNQFIKCVEIGIWRGRSSRSSRDSYEIY